MMRVKTEEHIWAFACGWAVPPNSSHFPRLTGSEALLGVSPLPPLPESFLPLFDQIFLNL